ncbi:MAG: GNAT family N-acetyltransferase [bacterium]
MEIRSALRSDAPAIAKLHADSWRFAYRDVLTSDYLDSNADRDRLSHWVDRLDSPVAEQRVDVLLREGRLVGFASIFAPHDPELGSFLNNLHVAEDSLRLGYGTCLMAQVQAHCFELAPSKAVFLWVVCSNVRAQAFYSRMGATIRAEQQWEPPGGGSALLYRMAWDSPSEIRVAANNSFKPTPLRGAA